MYEFAAEMTAITEMSCVSRMISTFFVRPPDIYCTPSAGRRHLETVHSSRIDISGMKLGQMKVSIDVIIGRYRCVRRVWRR